ncbi:peptidase U32 family protein [Arcobacter caeni]|nr:peptidase U32 family protein [Arcobacter caeni]
MEILAPAGNLDMAYAAIDAGADAIYVGPTGWSRRTNDSEASDKDIQLMIDYANKNNAEVRIVINTFPSPLEMKAYLKKISTYHHMGAHGYIASDIGVLKYLKSNFPDSKIHVSVGSGISNAMDVKFYEELGSDLIVLPYRWDDNDFKEVKKVSNIGLETFFYETTQTGKLCPGNCIMSSYLSYREVSEQEEAKNEKASANRGSKECYRVCQAAWDLKSDGKENKKAKLKHDANLMLRQLPYFMKINTEVFKISGREKPVDLIQDIVKFYRKVIDSLKKDINTNLAIYEEEMQELGNRWKNQKRKRLGSLINSTKEEKMKIS